MRTLYQQNTIYTVLHAGESTSCHLCSALRTNQAIGQIGWHILVFTLIHIRSAEKLFAGIPVGEPSPAQT